MKTKTYLIIIEVLVLLVALGIIYFNSISVHYSSIEPSQDDLTKESHEYAIILSSILLVLVFTIGVIIWNQIHYLSTPIDNINSGISLVREGKYEEAKALFQSLPDKELGQLSDALAAFPQFIQSREDQAKNVQQILMREVSKKTKEIEEQLKEMRELDKKKDEFISVASHELKTPITSIAGFVDLLKNPKVYQDKAAREKYLRIIEEDTERLAALITNILDLSKMDLKRLKFYSEKVKIIPLLQDIENEVKPMMDKKKLSLRYELQPKLPNISSDKIRLAQILINLMTNAIKYTQEGGTITMRVNHRDGLGKKENGDIGKDGEFEFCVKDTGVGMDATTLSHIFERFYQSDSSYTRKVGGSGLGLSVCRELVQAMGGRIWVDSTAGKGSSFSFTLPDIIPSPQNGQQASEAGQLDAGTPKKTNSEGPQALSDGIEYDPEYNELLRHMYQFNPIEGTSFSKEEAHGREGASVPEIVGQAQRILGNYALELLADVEGVKVESNGKLTVAGNISTISGAVLRKYRSVLGSNFMREDKR